MVNSQSKYKTLIAIIILLLLTNIAVLAYFMLSHKKKPDNRDKGRGGFEAVLQKEVGFNDDQVAQFKLLKETHWAKAKAQMDQLKAVKLSMYDLTKLENTPDSQVNQLADSIASLQKQIEINSFQHFRATRKICTPQQQPAYDSLMKKLISKMSRGSAKPPEKAKK